MRLFDILKNRVDAMEERADVEGLISALNEDDERIRQGSASALGRLGDPRAIEPLTQTLKDPDSGVKEEAITALGRIGDPQALPILIQALESEEIGIRWRAAEALGKIGDPQAIEPLTQTLKDSDKGVKEETITALGRIGDSKALPILIQALGSQEIGVRWRAAEALGKIGDPQAIEPLTQTLKDADIGVKEEAITALGRIALDPFISDLKSEDIGVREGAIISLNQIKKLKSGQPVEIEVKKVGDVKPVEVEVKKVGDVKKLVKIDKKKSLKTEALKAKKLDFNEKMSRLMREGHYRYIEKFVERSGYEYIDNFFKKSGYDYSFEDIQRMKDLLELKGLKFTEQEILFLIQEEIKKREYDDFQKKVIGDLKENLEEKIIPKLSKKQEEYLENYVKNYPESTPTQFQNLKRLLQENSQDTNNLTQKIEKTRKKIELKEFENKLTSAAYRERSINIVIGFKKRDFKDKKNLLISNDDYKYIENFVNKCRYSYDLGDVVKMKDFLEIKGIKIPEQEIQWIIQEEIKKQEYEEFKEKTIPKQSQELEDYLENYLKKYPESTPTQFQNLKRLLQENNQDTKNLTQKIEKTRKKIELKEFENKIVQPSFSETVPIIESKVVKDKAMKNSQMLYNLGNLFYDLGDPNEAMEYYDESIATCPEHIETWRNKGLLFYILGKPQKAAACYNHILTLDPNYFEAWIDVGLILFEMGKIREAKLCYDKALEIDPPKRESLTSSTREFLKNNPLHRESFEKFLEMIHSSKISIESSESRSPLSRIINEVNKQF